MLVLEYEGKLSDSVVISLLTTWIKNPFVSVKKYKDMAVLQELYESLLREIEEEGGIPKPEV